MKKLSIISGIIIATLTAGNSALFMNSAYAQPAEINFTSLEGESPYKFKLSPIVDFDSYLILANRVKEYRKNRLISLDTFLDWGNQSDVVILDTRSDSLFKSKHLKGAIHLDFTNFTQEALDALIPSKNTKILIYCNNNFKDEFFEPEYFTSKVARPVRNIKSEFATSLALNIPTFINLVGYGYENIYELGEQVFVHDSRLQFEGEAVKNMK